MMIDLFKPNAEGVLEIVGAVGFHHVPLTTIADLYCTPSGALSFENAIEVSGRLVGVSSLTVYSWEHGKSRPRNAQFASLVAVRGLGRREALKKLEMPKADKKKVKKLRRKPR